MMQAWADYLDQLRSGEEPEAGTHGPGLSHIPTSPGIRNADSWLDVPGSPRSGVLRGSAPGPLGSNGFPYAKGEMKRES